MTDGPVIRLFRFRPARVEFDQILRTEMLPDLRSLPGLLDVHVGRQGPDELGERIVASTWTDRASMVAGMGASLVEPVFHPERLAATMDRTLEVHDLEIVLQFDVKREPTLLRLFRGVVRTGELWPYVEQARIGTLADADAGRGPCALYLAADPPDRFVTVSLWPDWTAIETATGGDVRRPIATKDSGRIVGMDVSHYEVVPD